MSTPESFLQSIPQLLPDNTLIQDKARKALKTGRYESCLKLISDIRLTGGGECWIGKTALKFYEQLKTESCKKQ